MRKILLALLAAFQVINVYSQTFDDYKKAYEKVDITKVSGNVLYMLNEQMKESDGVQYAAFIQSKREQIYTRFDLGNKTNQQKFLDNYNDNLSKVKNRILINDVLMHINPKIIGDYGSDVLSRYQGNYASEYISTLLKPIIKSKLSEYTNSTINDIAKSILSDKSKIDPLLEQIVAYWKAAGKNIDKIRNDAGVIHQEVDNLIKAIPASDSIKNFLIHSSQGLAENIKTKLAAGWKGTINSLATEKNRYQKDFTDLYLNYSKEVKNKTEESFKTLGAAIDSLSRNEVKVYETLSKIQLDWEHTKTEINHLEGLMKDARRDPQSVERLAVQHAKLVAENFIRLDVVNKYVNKGVDVYNTISLLKSNVLNKVTNPQFLKSLSLDNLSLPTLSDACASAVGFTSQLSKTFPNCKPLQTVATAVNYLMAAVNIGVGVAELYSLNPMGLVNIFSGLSSLFGGKPEPSPEMKMMQQMMDYMQDQFKNINEHLKYIEEQLNTLIQTVQSMYRDMMKSFQIVNDKLDEILWQNNELYNATRVLVFAHITNCINADSNRIRQIIDDFKTYNDLDVFYQGNPDIAYCLPTLREFSTKLLNNVFSFSLSQPSDDMKLGANDLKYAYHFDSIYRHMVVLFASFYGNDCNAINSLGIPTAKITSNGSTYTGAKNMNACLGSNLNENFSVYYNYAAIKEIASLLTTYKNFYLFQNAKLPGYNPLSLLDFFKLPAQSITDRYSTIISNLQFLIDITNKSISQQSLMAGNNVLGVAYHYILGVYDVNKPNSNEPILHAIAGLENNTVFAKNFASMLVYGSINRSSTNDKARAKRFTDLYFSTEASRKDLLNAEFKLPMVTYDTDQVNNLILRINGRGREFTIPVPSPSFIISDEMAQSDGLYTLLAIKQKLVNALIDLTYFKSFKPVNGLAAEDYKYLIQELNK